MISVRIARFYYIWVCFRMYASHETSVGNNLITCWWWCDFRLTRDIGNAKKVFLFCLVMYWFCSRVRIDESWVNYVLYGGFLITRWKTYLLSFFIQERASFIGVYRVVYMAKIMMKRGAMLSSIKIDNFRQKKFRQNNFRPCEYKK